MLKLQVYIGYSRENPRTSIIVRISVIILLAFPPLVLSASSLFLSAFYYTLPFPFTPSYFSFLFLSLSHFYPTHFPSLLSPFPTPFLCLFLLPCLHPHTCTHINTFLHSTPHNTCNLRSERWPCTNQRAVVSSTFELCESVITDVAFSRSAHIRQGCISIERLKGVLLRGSRPQRREKHL